MQPLDEKETTVVFEKLFKFVGSNLKDIVERRSCSDGPGDESDRFCFCLQKNLVFYAAEPLVRRATNVSRDCLVGLGTCISKFTKGGDFRLTVQCLDLLATHAKHNVWLKPASKMSFLYGNHVLKGGGGRISDGIFANDGIVVFSMSDISLGFGVATKSTQDSRKLDPNGIIALHQADIGEYLRTEDDL